MAQPCEQAPAMTPMPCAAGAAIPDEILRDIFMRLPARSVGRCRCLSRAWAAALAPSDEFTDRHFRAANRSPRLFVLPVPSAGVTAVSAWSPDQPLGTTLVAFPRRPMRNAGTRPCRGLVVMEEEDPPACRPTDASVYYFCNPSTGQMTALPECRPLPPQHGGYAARDPRCYDSLGIGYDAVSGKFKVVRVISYGADVLPDCEVYVVDDAFCWRPAMGDAELPEAVGYTSSSEPSVFAQGHLYWMSEAEGTFQDKHVISFSLSGETFGVIQPPSRCSKYGLAQLEGRACLFSSISGVQQPCYDIWLLRDDHGHDDAGGLWELRCRINLAAAPPDVRRFMACLVRPLAFMDGGRRVLFRPGVCQSTKDSNPVHRLCAYTPATGAMEELLADGSLIAMPSENGCATTKAVVYEESLVSTGRPHEGILFSSASAQALCIALHRLPASDLGKLKLVCRAWRTVIETERFVKLHSRYARTRRRSPLHVFFPDAVAPEDRRRPGASVSQLHASPKLLDDRVVSCKPCHGLLLVTSSDTSDVRVVSPVMNEDTTFGFDSDKGARRSHGMGYDEATEEHVLVTLELASGGRSGGSTKMECVMDRLKDGVTRNLQCPASIRVWLDVPPVYVDGKMYWMSERGNRKNTMIMALDIHRECFEVLRAPRAKDGCRMVVAELAGRLCVAHPCAHTEAMTIWSKSTRGWTRELVIDLALWPEFSPKTAAGLVVPVEVDAAGDGRILLDTGRAVGLYDPRERRMHTVYSLTWRAGKRTDKFVAVALWEDSLVPSPEKCSAANYLDLISNQEHRQALYTSRNSICPMAVSLGRIGPLS